MCMFLSLFVFSSYHNPILIEFHESNKKNYIQIKQVWLNEEKTHDFINGSSLISNSNIQLIVFQVNMIIIICNSFYIDNHIHHFNN